jgi:hypothetical protein
MAGRASCRWKKFFNYKKLGRKRAILPANTR